MATSGRFIPNNPPLEVVEKPWWICKECGFDAKWHQALGEDNCLRLKAKEEASLKKQDE